MAAVVGELDLAALRQHLADRLPSYARPVFLRIREDVELTGTFKYSKGDLASQGYDPAASTDPIYFNHPESQAFQSLDADLYQRIQKGEIRL
jgi:fatty-acyl-CoA synthase